MLIRKRVALAARLGIVPSALNTTVKNRKDDEKGYTQCGRFSGQRKSLKQSPFQELESLFAAWFKETKGSIIVQNIGY
jgi:transcriptional regulator CtsR